MENKYDLQTMREILERIGLTHGEAEVYEALVELGTSTAGEIIKKANIASSKVYDVLHRLQTKGLASHIVKNGVRYYDATPPERLIDFLEERKNQLENAQAEIRKIIPEIKAKRAAKKEKNDVIVYTGRQGPRIVLKETIEAGRKGAELMGFGTDEDPYKDYLPADIEQHFREQRKYHVRWKLIFTKGKWRTPSPLAETRYLPKTLAHFIQPIRTMIYGDKVALVDFTKQPWITIIIEKKEIAQAFRQQFEFLWKQAKA